MKKEKQYEAMTIVVGNLVFPLVQFASLLQAN